MVTIKSMVEINLLVEVGNVSFWDILLERNDGAYMIWTLVSFFVSRDVVFVEDDFPYKAKDSPKQKKIENKILDDLVVEEEVMMGVVDQEQGNEVGVRNSYNEEYVEEFSGDVARRGGGGGVALK